MVTLARASSGLLYQSDGSLTGWTGGTQWTSVTATRIVAAPAVPMSPGALPNQVKGEPKWEAVGGVWYFSYDDIFTGSQSVPGIQVSNDRGISWVDLGQLKFASAIPGGGAAVVSFFLDPVSNNWHLHLLTGASVFNGTGLNGPFQQYIYKSTTGILGPYTQINSVGPNAGSWCDTSSSSGSCFWDGTNYWLFAGGMNAARVSLIGTWKATTLTGTFVQPTPSTPLFDVTVNGPIQTNIFSCENTSYGFNPVLGLYLIAVNSDITDGHNNYWSWGTMLQTSTTGTSFSGSGWKTIQWVCPADAQNVILDVTQFLHNGSNNQLATGPNGEMASIFSTQKPGGPFTPEYSNLQSRMAVLEPATALIRYTGAVDTTQRALMRLLDHTDITIECGAELTGVNGSGGSLVIAYRDDGAGKSSEYQATITANGHWSLVKVVASTPTTLAAGSGSQVFGNLGATLGYIHRLKVQVVGNVHTAWLDGELQYTFTDSSSPFTSGTTLSLFGQGVNCDVINLTCRTSDTITVNGMQPNTSVWLRAACGIPIAPIVANSSGVGTIAYGHFPLFSLDIAGTDYTVGTDSRIWGGDTLSFTGLPSAPPAIPSFIYFS